MVLTMTYSFDKVLEGFFVYGLDRYEFAEIQHLHGKAHTFPLSLTLAKGNHFSLYDVSNLLHKKDYYLLSSLIFVTGIRILRKQDISKDQTTKVF